VVALLIASTLMRDSIMTEKLSRRGLRVPSHYQADALRTTLVGQVMTTVVDTVEVDTPVRVVAERFRTNGHGAYPVVDATGHCVGIVARGDLLSDGQRPPGSPVGDAASRDVVAVTSSETLEGALAKILEEEVEHLPVIDDGALVGICTRSDILRAYANQRQHERTEPGWRPRRRLT
jgi:CBS domain-containing protein